MRTATIFETYNSVQHYLRLAEATLGFPLEPSVQLTPIDTFILQQLVDYYPAKLALVDLAAEATQGMSTIFCSALSRVDKIVVIASTPTQGTVDWQELVKNSMREAGQTSDKLVFLAPDSDEMNSEPDLGALIGPVSPPLFLLAAELESSDELEGRLDRLLTEHDKAILALTPLGEVGSCPVLASALTVCRNHPYYKLSLLKEISPFCADSQIGLIHRKDSRHVPEILNRIKQLYEGNFDFVGILAANVELQVKMRLSLETTEKLNDQLSSSQSEVNRLVGELESVEGHLTTMEAELDEARRLVTERGAELDEERRRAAERESELHKSIEELARVRRALATRTEELEAAYAVKSSPPEYAENSIASGNRVGKQNPVGQVLSDLSAAAERMRRGSP
jgi:hypothetical protein